MLKQLFITILLISLVYAKNSFTSATVSFALECESSLCQDYEVSYFIEDVKNIFPEATVHLVQVWAKEVTLIICSTSSITATLNSIENSEDAFDGVSVENIRFNAPCIVYNDETKQTSPEEIINSNVPLIAGSAAFTFM